MSKQLMVMDRVLRLQRNFSQREPTFLADHRNRVTAFDARKCHAVAPINHTFICTLSFRPSTVHYRFAVFVALTIDPPVDPGHILAKYLAELYEESDLE